MKKTIPIFTAWLLLGCAGDRSKEIDRAMRQYDSLLLHGQSDSIAGKFAINGELAGENQAPIIGRDSIRKTLRSFKGVVVLKYLSTADSTLFYGDTAVQSGSYVQIVKIPSGDTLELGGEFVCTWIPFQGEWMIKKMFTHHYRNLKEENWLNRLPENNIAKQYGKIIDAEGPAAARVALAKLRKDSAHYELKEKDFNHLGYNLMAKGKDQEALEVFKITVELFPTSWNAYDSYGEGLLKSGKKQEAISMYQKSLQLNPKNENGKKMLNDLGQ